MYNNTYYLNFEPTTELITFANRALGRIVEFAPYDSSAHSEIERHEARYWCRLEIASRFGCFKALAESGNPRAAFEKARRRLAAELSRWRRNRVYNPPVTVTGNPA